VRALFTSFSRFSNTKIKYLNGNSQQWSIDQTTTQQGKVHNDFAQRTPTGLNRSNCGNEKKYEVSLNHFKFTLLCIVVHEAQSL
jgi:hypothetical protein